MKNASLDLLRGEGAISSFHMNETFLTGTHYLCHFARGVLYMTETLKVKATFFLGLLSPARHVWITPNLE